MYIIEQFTAPSTYDEAIRPDPTWTEVNYFMNRSWKTERGAQNAINKFCQRGNYPTEKFRVVEQH